VARADRIYAEQWVKVVLAQETAKRKDMSNAAAEVQARCSDEYAEALKAYREAVRIDEENRFMREARIAKMEAWRTQSSNERALGNVR
jgi:predicted TPR repeat methyltransferase